MAMIVAARFETFDAAKAAAASLMRSGISSDALHTFFVNPAGSHDQHALGGDRAADPESRGATGSTLGMAAICGLGGAIIGGIITTVFDMGAFVIAAAAGVGAYVGSLAGAMNSLGKKRRPRTAAEHHEQVARQGRPSGVLLAVRVEPADEDRVGMLLKDAGGVEVERARGVWRDGMWQDFDPLKTPVPENPA